jgi:uncharacterized protein with ACT and thioredoxin-like domain
MVSVLVPLIGLPNGEGEEPGLLPVELLGEEELEVEEEVDRPERLTRIGVVVAQHSIESLAGGHASEAVRAVASSVD